MYDDVIKLVNSYVYRKFKTEEDCKCFCNDKIMSREDLVGEMLLFICERLEYYDSSRSKLSTYVYMLCDYKCKYFLRKSKRKLNTISLDSKLKVDDKLDYICLFCSDEDIVKKLKDKDAIEYVRKHSTNATKLYLYGYTQKEIAKELKMSQTNVSKIIKRDLERARTAINR